MATGSGTGSRAPPLSHPPRSSTTTPSSASTRRPSSTPSSSDATAAAAAAAGASSSAAGATAGASSSAAAAAATSPATTSGEPTAAASTDGTPVVNLDDCDNVSAVGVKRKRKSEVWLEFEEVTEGGKTKAQCNWCKKKLVASSKDGTNHLRNHLKSCASRQAQKGLKQTTLKLGKDQNGAVVIEKYVFDQQVARKELALMICIHEYPLSMVNHAGFRRFCSALQPHFKHVSRNAIKKDILGMYEVYKEQLMERLQKCQSRIAVTTDIWTANHQRKGYMAVTVHYLDDDWKLKSFLLRFVYVLAPHTSEVISDVLHDVLHDWHLEKKVSTVTLDNCTTNDDMIVKMNDKLPLPSLILRGRLLHMRCAAHIINLIVKDGMSVMEKGIERVRESVGFWCATPKRHEKFERTVAQMHLKYNKRIALDCKTRWNSTYLMISTALEYQAVFDRLSRQESLCAPFKPTADDWEFARELCGRLKLFYDATEILSGTNYVTANLFFPKICGISLAIDKWRTSEDPRVESMSEKMKEKFQKYWADVHGLMEVATVLDPRYKLKFMKAYYSTIYGENSPVTEKEVARVRSLLYDLVLEYQGCMEGMGTTDGVGAVAKNVQNEGDDLVFGLFDKFLSEEPEETSTYVRTELDLFLEEPTLPRTQELNIIHWWEFAGVKYPTLRKIARDIMAIPVTIVASESVFSTGGRTISPHRSRLAPKTAEGLMCMQAWSRADMLGDQSCFINALMTCMEDEEEEMDDSESTIID